MKYFCFSNKIRECIVSKSPSLGIQQRLRRKDERMKTEISNPISIMLVDDHPIIIEGLKSALARYAHLKILGVVNSGKEVMPALERLKPEIILLDIGLPDISGIKIVEEIKRQKTDVKVLIYTMFANPEYLKVLISLGVKGFLSKDSPIEELVRALQILHQEGNYFQSSQLENIFSESACREKDILTSAVDQLPLSYPKNSVPQENSLTEREKEVLVLIAEGLKNKEIALKLNLNQRTVETHRRNLMIKLNIKTQARLVKYVLENGLDLPALCTSQTST